MSKWAGYDTDELRIMEHVANERAEALSEEIARRTCPWPWPKTPSPMAQMWRAEFESAFRDTLLLSKLTKR